MRTLHILAALAVCISVYAETKTAEELRVYINPGHGSWTTNDRPMKVIRDVDGVLTVIDPNASSTTPDTTAFFESNTNLRKCLAIVDKLESYGLKIDRTKNQTNSNPYRVGAALDLENNICMSHVMVGPYPYEESLKNVCNRSLTTIAVEAQTNNFDMFLSVHSNAQNGEDGHTANYPIMLYRGTDAEDRSPGSKAMAQLGFDYIRTMAIHHWTSTGVVKGDVTFYGSESYWNCTGVYGYLGALHHTVPGYLAEGYFHDVQPARYRAMNFDADRMEGYLYARAIADYFGLTKETTGDIYGVVRDANTLFTHTYYNPRSGTNDTYKPLNGATVILSQNDVEITRYTTDNGYNGVFVFPDLAAGTYTLTLSCPGYKSKSTEVTVTSASISYPEVFLEGADPQEGEDRANFAYDLSYTHEDGSDSYTVSFKSTGYAPRSFLRLTNVDDPEDVADIAMGEAPIGTHEFTIDMQELTDMEVVKPEQQYHWSVVLESNEITDFKQVASSNNSYYNTYTSGSDLTTAGGVVICNDPEDSELFGKIITAAGYAQGIEIYSPEGVQEGSTFSTSGIMKSTSAWSLCRGDYSNGKAVFCDFSDGASSGYWAFDPKTRSFSNMLLGTVGDSGVHTYNEMNIGGSASSIAFRGEGANRVIYSYGEDYPTGNSSYYILKYAIGNDDTIDFQPQILGNGDGESISYASLLGNQNTEVIACNHGLFIGQTRVAGQNSATIPAFIFIDYNGNVLLNSSTIDGLNSGGSGLALSPDMSRLAISNCEDGIMVFDVEWSGDTPTLKNGVTYTASTGSANRKQHTQMKFDNAGNLATFARGTGFKLYSVPTESPMAETPARTALIMVTPAKTRLHTGDNRANYAYDFEYIHTDCSPECTLRYKSTGYVPFTQLHLVNKLDPSETYTFDLGESFLGENEYTLDITQLQLNQNYLWSIKMIGDPITEFTELAGGSREYPANTPGGVVVITDSSDPNFGKIITAGGYASGIDIYSPFGERLNATPYYSGSSLLSSGNQWSLTRGAYSNGRVIFCDYSDGSSGLWEFNPEAETLENLYQGTRGSSGAFTYGGNIIGGSATGIAFRGKGAEREMFIFCEDYPTGNAGNYLVKYAIGNSNVIDFQPTIIGESNGAIIKGYMANCNVNVVACQYGFFLSQIRYPGNNSESYPGFIFVDNKGVVKFKSSVLVPGGSSGAYRSRAFASSSTGLNSSGSGLALSADASKLAVSDTEDGIHMFDVDWEEDAETGEYTPVLSNGVIYEAVSGATDAYKEHTQLQFDPAGNLVTFARGSGLKLYSVPSAAPTSETYAPEEEAVEGPYIYTGIYDVEQGKELSIEYFTLQGIRVENPSPGMIVIRRQGNKSEKILIK